MVSTRRLAAIMFTDIAGYTALMGADEEKAFALLKKNREIQKPIIEQFGGKWLKEIGDGVLASFHTISDAVYCAASIQYACTDHDDLNLRIGIHQGEVVFEGDDVFGDGVNVASRLESQAPVGGILVSETVNQNVYNKKGISSTFVGEEQLKNVRQPIKTFLIEVDMQILDQVVSNISHQKPAKSKKGIYAIAGAAIILVLAYLVYIQPWVSTPVEDITDGNTRPSIAVIPFENLSNDPEQEYFSLGMMDAVMNHLFKIRDMTVISRTTMMRYKNPDLTIPELADELGVSYFVTGSVLKSGSNILLNVQLIEGESDHGLWSHQYKGTIDQSFEFQSAIAMQIADSLQVQITPEIKSRINRPLTQNMEAYPLFLQARHILWYDTKQLEIARSKLEEAISLDSNFAAAYALLARLWMNKGLGDFGVEASQVREVVRPLLNKALALDEDDFDSNIYMANYRWWYHWDFEGAEKYFDKAFRLYSPSKGSIPSYAVFNLVTGDVSKAIEYSEVFLKQNPYSLSSYIGSGLAYCWGGQTEKAVKISEEALDLFGTRDWIVANVVHTLICAGQYTRTIDVLNSMTDDYENLPISSMSALAIAYNHCGKQEETQRLLELLRDRSKRSSSGSPSYYTALVYADLAEVDSSFLWLDKGLQGREPVMHWLKIQSRFAPLHSDPRWQEMLDKIGFPQ